MTLSQASHFALPDSSSYAVYLELAFCEVELVALRDRWHADAEAEKARADALQRLANRVPLPDLQYLVIAVLIQREAGGNLAELMSKVSQLVRQRLKLLGEVRVMSAEGRLSAWILCLLPVGVSGLFALTSPDYLRRFLDDPAGPAMLASAGVLMFLGVLWMRMIVQIQIGRAHV